MNRGYGLPMVHNVPGSGSATKPSMRGPLDRDERELEYYQHAPVHQMPVHASPRKGSGVKAPRGSHNSMGPAYHQSSPEAEYKTNHDNNTYNRPVPGIPSHMQQDGNSPIRMTQSKQWLNSKDQHALFMQQQQAHALHVQQRKQQNSSPSDKYQQAQQQQQEQQHPIHSERWENDVEFHSDRPDQGGASQLDHASQEIHRYKVTLAAWKLRYYVEHLRLSGTRHAANDLQNEIGRLQTNIKVVNEKNIENGDTITNLQIQLENSGVDKEFMMRSEDEVMKLNDTIKALASDVQSLQNENEALRARAVSAEAWKTNKEEEILSESIEKANKLAQEHQELEQHNSEVLAENRAALRAQLAAMEEKLEKTKNALENTKLEHDTMHDAINKEKISLSEHIRAEEASLMKDVQDRVQQHHVKQLAAVQAQIDQHHTDLAVHIETIAKAARPTINELIMHVYDILENPDGPVIPELIEAYGAIAANCDSEGQLEGANKAKNNIVLLETGSDEEKQSFIVSKLELIDDVNYQVLAKAYDKLSLLQSVAGHSDASDKSILKAKEIRDKHIAAVENGTLLTRTLSRREEAAIADLQYNGRAKIQEKLLQEEKLLREQMHLKLQANEQDVKAGMETIPCVPVTSSVPVIHVPSKELDSLVSADIPVVDSDESKSNNISIEATASETSSLIDASSGVVSSSEPVVSLNPLQQVENDLNVAEQRAAVAKDALKQWTVEYVKTNSRAPTMEEKTSGSGKDVFDENTNAIANLEHAQIAFKELYVKEGKRPPSNAVRRASFRRSSIANTGSAPLSPAQLHKQRKLTVGSPVQFNENDTKEKAPRELKVIEDLLTVAEQKQAEVKAAVRAWTVAYIKEHHTQPTLESKKGVQECENYTEIQKEVEILLLERATAYEALGQKPPERKKVSEPTVLIMSSPNTSDDDLNTRIETNKVRARATAIQGMSATRGDNDFTAQKNLPDIAESDSDSSSNDEGTKDHKKFSTNGDISEPNSAIFHKNAYTGAPSKKTKVLVIKKAENKEAEFQRKIKHSHESDKDFNTYYAAQDKARAIKSIKEADEREAIANQYTITRQLGELEEKQALADRIIAEGKLMNMRRFNATILIVYRIRKYVKQCRKLKALAKAREERELLRREILLQEEESLLQEIAILEVSNHKLQIDYDDENDKEMALIEAEITEANRLKKIRETQRKVAAIRKKIEEKDNYQRNQSLVAQRRRSVALVMKVDASIEDKRFEMNRRLEQHRASIIIQAYWRCYIVGAKMKRIAQDKRNAEIFERRERAAIEAEKRRRDLAARCIQRFHRLVIHNYVENKTFIDAAHKLAQRKEAAMKRMMDRKGLKTPVKVDKSSTDIFKDINSSTSSVQRVEETTLEAHKNRKGNRSRRAMLLKKKMALAALAADSDSGDDTPVSIACTTEGDVTHHTRNKDAIQGKKSAAKDVMEDDFAVQQRAEELQKKITTLEKDLFLLQDNHDTIESQLKRTNSEKESLQNMITEITWRYGEAEKAITALTDDLSMADSDYHKLQTEYTNHKDGWAYEENEYKKMNNVLKTLESLNEEMHRQKECENMRKVELEMLIMDAEERAFHSLGYSRFLEEQLFDARKREKLLTTNSNDDGLPYSRGHGHHMRVRESDNSEPNKFEEEGWGNEYDNDEYDKESNASSYKHPIDITVLNTDREHAHTGQSHQLGTDSKKGKKYKNKLKSSQPRGGRQALQGQNSGQSPERTALLSEVGADFGPMFADDDQSALNTENTSSSIIPEKQMKNSPLLQLTDTVGTPRVNTRQSLESDPSLGESDYDEEVHGHGHDSDEEFDGAHEGKKFAIEKVEKIQNNLIRDKNIRITEKSMRTKQKKRIVEADNALVAYKVAAEENVHKEEEERLHRLIKKLKTELQLSSQALKDKELENKDDRADDLNNIQKLLQRIKNLKLVREDLKDENGARSEVKTYIDPQDRNSKTEFYNKRKISPYTTSIKVSTPFALMNKLIEVVSIDEYFCASIAQMREVIEMVLAERGDLETLAMEVQNQLDENVASAIYRRNQDRKSLSEWVETFDNLTGNKPEPEDKRNSLRFKELAEAYSISQKALIKGIHKARGMALQGELKRYRYESGAHLIMRITGQRPAPFKYRFMMPHERWSEFEDPMKVKTQKEDMRKISTMDQACAILSLVMSSSERLEFTSSNSPTKTKKLSSDNFPGKPIGGGSPTAEHKALGVRTYLERFPEFQDREDPNSIELMKLEDQLITARTRKQK